MIALGRAGGHPAAEGRPAAQHQAADRRERSDRSRSPTRQGSRALRRPDGVPLVLPAGDVRPPVYQALRSDLAASGDRALQPANLQASPMRSWIGLYALLRMIRDAKLTTFTRDGDHDDAQAGERRTDAGHLRRRELDAGHRPRGLYKRAGTNHWVSWRWDSNAPRRPARGWELRQGLRARASTRSCVARQSALRNRASRSPRWLLPRPTSSRVKTGHALPPSHTVCARARRGGLDPSPLEAPHPVHTAGRRAASAW